VSPAPAHLSTLLAALAAAGRPHEVLPPTDACAELLPRQLDFIRRHLA
jgi:hypothetical protein